MEFTVSKADLVRELNLSQGVVEKKTTIPILSNVLMEAAGDRVQLTATDLELGIRCSLPGAGLEGRRGDDSGAAFARLRPAAAGCRPEGEVSGEPLGEPDVRALADADRGHLAGELPGAAADAGGAGGNSHRLPGIDDREDDFRDLVGGVAVYAERSAAAVEAERNDDGSDGRAPAGASSRAPRRSRGSRRITAPCFRRRPWGRF